MKLYQIEQDSRLYTLDCCCWFYFYSFTVQSILFNSNFPLLFFYIIFFVFASFLSLCMFHSFSSCLQTNKHFTSTLLYIHIAIRISALKISVLYAIVYSSYVYVSPDRLYLKQQLMEKWLEFRAKSSQPYIHRVFACVCMCV